MAQLRALALTAAFWLSCQELVLIDKRPEVAEAVALDLRYGVPVGPSIVIRSGTERGLHGAGLMLRINAILSARVASSGRCSQMCRPGNRVEIGLNSRGFPGAPRASCQRGDVARSTVQVNHDD